MGKIGSISVPHISQYQQILLIGIIKFITISYMVGQKGFEPLSFDYESNALNQLSYSPIFYLVPTAMYEIASSFIPRRSFTLSYADI